MEHVLLGVFQFVLEKPAGIMDAVEAVGYAKLDILVMKLEAVLQKKSQDAKMI